jgi:hypothetical protein
MGRAPQHAESMEGDNEVGVVYARHGSLDLGRPPKMRLDAGVDDLPSGIYLLRLTAGGGLVQTRRVLLLR